MGAVSVVGTAVVVKGLEQLGAQGNIGPVTAQISVSESGKSNLKVTGGDGSITYDSSRDDRPLPQVALQLKIIVPRNIGYSLGLVKEICIDLGKNVSFDQFFSTKTYEFSSRKDDQEFLRNAMGLSWNCKLPSDQEIVKKYFDCYSYLISQSAINDCKVYFKRETIAYVSHDCNVGSGSFGVAVDSNTRSLNAATTNLSLTVPFRVPRWGIDIDVNVGVSFSSSHVGATVGKCFVSKNSMGNVQGNVCVSVGANAHFDDKSRFHHISFDLNKASTVLPPGVNMGSSTTGKVITQMMREHVTSGTTDRVNYYPHDLDAIFFQLFDGITSEDLQRLMF